MAVTLAAAVLFSGFMRYKDEKKQKALLTGSNLNDYEYAAADLATTTFLSLQEQYENQKQYMEHSILMNVDPGEVATATLTYMISAVNKELSTEMMLVNNAVDIVTAYQVSLPDHSLCQELRDLLKIDYADPYLSEIITVSLNDSNLMVIRIIADDLDKAEAIAAVVEKRVDLITEDQKQRLDYSIQKVGRTSSYMNDVELKIRQAEEKTALQETLTQMSAITNKLTSEQLDYLYYNTGEHSGGSSGISLKNLVLGAFFGFIAGMGIVLILCLASDKLQSSVEVTDTLQFQLLGIIPYGDKKSGIFNKGKTDPEKAISFVSERILLMLDQTKQQNLLFTGSCLDEKMVSVIQQIQSRLQSETVHCFIAENSMLNVAETLQALKKADTAILFEMVKKTKFTDLAEEKQSLESCGKDCLGVVLFQ